MDFDHPHLPTASSFPPSLPLQTNYHSSLSLTSLFNSISSLPCLKRLHARILTQGLSGHLAITTKLLSLAAFLSPTMDYAHKVFDASPHRDSFMWNTLIRCYADLGPCGEVPFLYKQMHRTGLSPDHFTFPSVLRSCAVLSALREGKEAHCHVIKHGFDNDHFVQSALVSMYSQNGEVSNSELVFGEMVDRNVVSWTAMIAGYVQNCFLEKALSVFGSMVASGMQPNEITIVSVLPALKGLECLNFGRTIHGFVIKLSLNSFISLANALIAMYGKCGCVDVASSLFEEMPVRSLVSWNSMIAVHEQSDEGNKAIKLFRRMLTEKVKFDCVTLVSVLSACAGMGDLETGKWAHELARSNGLEADIRIGNILVDMYAKCGRLDCARDAFEKLQWRGRVSWSAMIGAYAAHGQPEEALKLFALMKEEGVRPNSFTFTSVLAACSHSGLVEEGLKHFDSMRRDYQICPSLEHCACMVDVLGRAGRVVDAYEFIKRMPMEPDKGVWGALLGACRIHGDLELAEFVAVDLLQYGHSYSTFYVLMSNMYAEVGRWEDAARMRKLMREMELKKTPGSSSVDIVKNATITR